MSHEDPNARGPWRTTLGSPTVTAPPTAVSSPAARDFRGRAGDGVASPPASSLNPSCGGDSGSASFLHTPSPPPGRGDGDSVRMRMYSSGGGSGGDGGSPSPSPPSPHADSSAGSGAAAAAGGFDGPAAAASTSSTTTSSPTGPTGSPPTPASSPSPSIFPLPEPELTATGHGLAAPTSAAAYSPNASVSAFPLAASFTTSPGSPAATGACGNPRRSLNAAFTLSPRTESDVEASEEYNSDAPSVCLDLDRHDPPLKRYCNLGSLEERRAFVTEGCVSAAQCMSTQRILDHLLPALLTAFEADDYGESFDDCAPCIARALPQIVACMDARTTMNMTYFMGLIMALCCSAEAAVAKVVTASLQAILDMVDDDVLLDLFLPFVLAMRVSFWGAPRVVAAGLLGCLAMRPAVLQAAGLTVSDMFNYYAECSSDASAMVRSAVATSLHDWVRVAAAHRLTLAEMPLPLLKSLATDDLSDTVRYLLIEEVVRLAQLMGPKSTSKYLLGTFVSAYMDPSWRVRYTAASQLGAMAALVLNADDLELVLETLSRDEEPETRAAVARQLDQMVQHCSADVVQHCCVPVAVALSQDPDPVVRRSAARHYHCFVFGSDEVVRTMCKALRGLMQDTAFVVQENAIESLGNLVTALEESVRMAEQHSQPQQLQQQQSQTANALSSSTSSRSSASRRQGGVLSPLTAAHSRGSRHHKSPHRSSARPASSSSGAAAAAPAATGGSGGSGDSGGGGGEEVSVALMRKRADSIVRSFVAEVLVLGESRNWRIRDAVVRVVHHFCRLLSADQFRPLTNMLFIALHDPVSTVRSQAVRTLKEVAAAYGGDWAAQTSTELLHSDTLAPQRAVSYMWRVVMIQCLAVLLPMVSELSPRDPRRQQLLATTAPLLLDYVADRVPNVRLATAHALPGWYVWFDVTERERSAYNAAIRVLQADADGDVLDAAHSIPYNTERSGSVMDGDER